MKVIKGDITNINHIDGLKNSVVVIGNFDGLHTYHQKLLWEAERIAAVDNLDLVVITFNKSFDEYYGQENDWLLKNDDKTKMVENYFAVDYYIELEVNKNLEQCSPKEFENWLKEVVHAKKLVEGSDFTYGTNRKGTVEDLVKAFGEDNVEIIKRKANISSTKIREYLRTGKLDKANKLLFKPLLVYLKPSNDDMWQIAFPNIQIKQGYYRVLIDYEVHATIVVGEKNKVSIVDTDVVPEKIIKTMILEKYLGATLN